jgi:hypothetical protein
MLGHTRLNGVKRREEGERGGRREERGSSPRGSTDGNNRSPGSTLGQGERWKRGRGRLLCAGKREWARGAHGGGWGAWARAQRQAGLRAEPTSLYSISPASNQDQSTIRTLKLDEPMPRLNIR